MGGEKSYEDLCNAIHYSDRYSDDVFEYRHVILPRAMLKRIPQSLFDDVDRSVLRILKDSEWRGIGIVQSIGWEHFAVHAPEPHILLFRREQNFSEKYGAHGKERHRRAKWNGTRQGRIEFETE